ncbi:hypothetical protein [Algoriphagus sediminis]|uniref:Uncharacterized protein n=1 Tax=Algoriphagus sediminis TaxID=3057113 RepID=A0ABT7YHB2_9BACT|nr:hypothetical protein [Algoriphagus sediminis]MDN3205925.1 hypothetical protein [Algoriphagus sediminis]
MNASELEEGSKLRHPSFGTGMILSVEGDYYKIYFYKTEEIKTLARDFEGFEIEEGKQAEKPSISISDIEKAVRNVVADFSEKAPLIPLGGRWMGGTVVLEPNDENLSVKEIPMESFFRKIVMVREKLRVLEQNINNHPKLDDEDRIHLQQYITRCYGSLTTFNVLFAYKEDQFKGSGK